MMSYDKTAVMGGKEIWREETVRVDSGGYNLDMTGLKEGDVVEKGTPLIVDFSGSPVCRQNSVRKCPGMACA